MMPDIPGLPADVYFGSTDAPLPAWNGTDEWEADEAEEDREPTDDERRAVSAILGFDPRDIDDD